MEFDVPRKHKRVRMELPVRIRMLEPEDSPEWDGLLYDLSAGGCALHCDRELPIGSRVQVRITLDESLASKLKNPILTARGAICRIQRHMETYLLSVRFFT